MTISRRHTLHLLYIHIQINQTPWFKLVTTFYRTTIVLKLPNGQRQWYRSFQWLWGRCFEVVQNYFLWSSFRPKLLWFFHSTSKIECVYGITNLVNLKAFRFSNDCSHKPQIDLVIQHLWLAIDVLIQVSNMLHYFCSWVFIILPPILPLSLTIKNIYLFDIHLLVCNLCHIQP